MVWIVECDSMQNQKGKAKLRLLGACNCELNSERGWGEVMEWMLPEISGTTVWVFPVGKVLNSMEQSWYLPACWRDTTAVLEGYICVDKKSESVVRCLSSEKTQNN